MKVGLVGFPGSGKSTVFGALTGLAVETGFAARADKANLGVVKVPDPRVDALTEIFHPKKKVYAEITFRDLGGGREGELDRTVLNSMREVDALAQVLRGFENAGGDGPDPLRELRDLETETILADLEIVEQRLGKLAKDKSKAREVELLEKVRAALEAAAKERGLGLVVLSAPVEMDIAQMPESEQREFLASLGVAEPARHRFIRAAFELIGLIGMLTTGPDECRAWPIPRGIPAPRAAGKIHSDIERGFIRAEVIHWRDLVELGSEARCREAGKLRVEGKEYVIQDGDVVNFRFNV